MYLRKNYAELLSSSMSAQDSTKSTSFCGRLIQYSNGTVKVEAQELSHQLKMRMETGVTEIPPELIQKANLIVHQVNTGYRKRG
ncbi:MAG: hypothetical protein WCK53_11655 [Methanomicrobiales archaeon]